MCYPLGLHTPYSTFFAKLDIPTFVRHEYQEISSPKSKGNIYTYIYLNRNASPPRPNAFESSGER